MFLILEALCIIMMVNNLPYQKRKLVSFGNSISGCLFKTQTNLTNYFSLKDENQMLMEHNAMLMSALHQHINDSSFVIDSSLLDYRFIPANVINNSIYNVNNFLVIDRGRKDGIKKDMGVICENGIVGKIANASLPPIRKRPKFTITCLNFLVIKNMYACK